jgi:predicted metal-binding transcription factor (methanogenesis marker protein 9)
MLEKTKKYIDDNNKRPLKSSSIVEEKKMANWLGGCLGSHGKRKKESEQIIFKEFITDEKYQKFFMNSDDDIFKCMLEKTKKYMDDNNKRPSKYNLITEEEKNISRWIAIHIGVRGKRKKESEQIMFKEFITDEKYKKFFMNGDDIFKCMLDKTKEYIDNNNKRPSQYKSITEQEKKLAVWISENIGNHGKRKKESEQIMFKEFITDDKYKHFLSHQAKENYITIFQN